MFDLEYAFIYLLFLIEENKANVLSQINAGVSGERGREKEEGEEKKRRERNIFINDYLYN